MTRLSPRLARASLVLGSLALSLAALLVPLAASAVPFWGAKASQPASSDPATLAPGATLVVTDEPVLAQTTGANLNILNGDSPAQP